MLNKAILYDACLTTPRWPHMCTLWQETARHATSTCACMWPTHSTAPPDRLLWPLCRIRHMRHWNAPHKRTAPPLMLRGGGATRRMCHLTPTWVASLRAMAGGPHAVLTTPPRSKPTCPRRCLTRTSQRASTQCRRKQRMARHQRRGRCVWGERCCWWLCDIAISGAVCHCH